MLLLNYNVFRDVFPDHLSNNVIKNAKSGVVMAGPNIDFCRLLC